MKKITYIVGDLFASLPTDRQILIPHIVNNEKRWGSGFVVPLGRIFPKAESAYREWDALPPEISSGCPYPLSSFQLSIPSFCIGETQIVKVSDTVHVANMIAQHSTISPQNYKPIKYKALVKCMDTVGDCAIHLNSEIIAPKFGSERAGGNWDFIEELIEELWLSRDISVTIYSLKE